VELPGIEPAPKILLNCKNAKSGTRHDMKAREMTWENGPGVDGINTSAAHLRSP
jgi:hypothetical protein